MTSQNNKNNTTFSSILDTNDKFETGLKFFLARSDPIPASLITVEPQLS
jgi:hypothetical protein